MNRISKQRILFIQAVIVLLIGCSLYDIITGREHWPFSPYAMYAGVQRERSLSAVQLFGVTEENTQYEIPLNSFQYIQPFDPSRLSTALARMENNPERERLLHEALRDCLKRYEKLRVDGRHQGPRLQGLRLYELQWSLEPWAGNADRPSSRRLLAEVQQSEGES